MDTILAFHKLLTILLGGQRGPTLYLHLIWLVEQKNHPTDVSQAT